MRCGKLFLPLLLSLIVAVSSVQSGWAQGAAGVPPQQKTKQDLFGKIVDDAGEPLPGVVVFPKGEMAKAVTSDLDGNYSVRVPSGKNTTFVFQFLGMETQEIAVSAPGRKDVVMKSDNLLEEAVISVGYGLAQKREDMVGSAFQVTSDQLKFRPAERMDNMLVGMVPGLSIIEDSSGGRPSVKLRVRGDGSLSASNEPLWIIDGVPVYSNGNSSGIAGMGTSSISPISLMNPDDIESMTVLKDASTVALYGADGSNGVILVTTKKAKSGKLSMNASVRYGYDDIDPSTRIKYLHADQWLALAKEGWVNSGRDIKNFPYQDNEYQTYTGVDTNWYPYYQRPGSSMQVNLSASGGSDRMSSLISGGYYHLNSPYKGNSTDRFTFRENTSIKLSKKLSATFILDASFTKTYLLSTYSSFHEILPIFEPYNEDGSYRWYNYYSSDENEYKVTAKKFWTYLDEMDLDSFYSNAMNAKGALTLKYKATDHLSLTSQTAATFMSGYDARYDSKYTLSGMGSDTSNSGSSSRNAVFDYDYFIKLHANYDRTFGGKHKVTGMAGWEWRSTIHPYLGASASGFVNDNVQEVSYSITSDTRRGTSNVTYRKNLSYIAQASYGYDKRYNVSANYRRQGNSAFSEYSRWSDFASIGASWNVHREKWFKSKLFSSISIKGTFGTAGNSRVNTASSYGEYSLSDSYSYANSPGALQTKTPNPALSWERTFKTDFQIQLGILKRFHLTIEPYRELTTNVLYNARVSSIVDDSGINQNIGEISNNGIEFIFESVNIKNGDFTWSTSINGARNRNMIEKLYGDAYTGYFDHIWIEGQSKDAHWLVRWAGVDPVSGAPMWYDKNGDLTYTFSYEDRVFQPYSHQPDLYGGVSNDFTWKSFNLRVMFDYTLGGWLYESVFRDDGYSVIDENQVPEALDHWTTPGVGNLNPSFIYKGWTNSYYNSTRCLYNKTSVQLRSVSLSYTLPKNFIKKAGIEACTLSLIGNNLYFWSPAQSKTMNSYKTVRFGNQGMRREFSFQVSLNF